MSRFFSICTVLLLGISQPLFCATNAYVAVTKEVNVINTQTDTSTVAVLLGNTPSMTAITPNGLKVYTPNFSDDNVSVVDTTTNTLIATISMGSRSTLLEQRLMSRITQATTYLLSTL